MAAVLQKKGGLIPVPLALVFAVILDALDFLVVGLIPAVGLGIDVFGVILIFLAVGPRYLIFTAPEFVDIATLTVPILLPVELVPSYTITMLLGKWKLLG